MKRLNMRKLNIGVLYAAGILLLVATFCLGILLGATKLALPAVLRVLFCGERSSPEANILLFVRIPRTTAGLLCGAALAVAGAVIQAVLANRLASPSIIGVNAGAGLAVTLCAAFGILGGWKLSLFAFLGAFLTVMTVSLGAKKWGASRGTVILMGVAINSILGAVSDTVRTFLPEVSILSSDFRVGDFSAVNNAKLVPAAILILTALLVLQSLANDLDVLALGDETAKSLGLKADGMRRLFLLLAAALSGAAVSIAGLLSFVGLLVPHAVRRVATTESRHLLPLCALFGAGFVSLCDTISRVIFAPYELPVGIILAFLGGPFFLALLRRRKGGHSHA